MNWNDFSQEVHQNEVDKGEWDKPRTLDDVICDCLVHLSNAYTAYQEGKPKVYHLCQPSGEKEHICDLDCGGKCSIAHGDPCQYRDPKPEGVAVELADCVLRLLDYLATTDVDLSNMYPVKIMADGPFTSFVTDIVINLISARIDQGNDKAENGCGSLRFFIERILGFAAVNNIDLESILREKHEYNKSRPYRHGGKEL